MFDSLAESYEAFPYNSKPVTASDIGSVAAVARLHGLNPPSPDCARVLELGAASGGNLIPLAYRYPGAKFTGIDLARGQVTQGKKEIAALGLRNVTLDVMSIADITDEFGVFDYIICHGVYSWVPPEIQDAILRVCARNLAPEGIAYVSYNTYPGWHVRGMVREMVMFHDDPSLRGPERVARARAFVELLASQGGSAPSVHTLSIIEEAMTLRTQDDSHFMHEQLEPYNAPIYFTEFVQRASSWGLRHVSEAKFGGKGSSIPAWAEHAARNEAGDVDVIRAQQYVDFATARSFRRSLLCHAAQAPRPNADPEAIRDLDLVLHATPASPSEEDAAKDATARAFEAPDGVKITTNNPLVLGAFDVLLRVAPASLSFAALLQRVNDRLSVDEVPGLAPPVDHGEPLAQAMLQCAQAGLVQLHCGSTAFATRVSDRPLAWPIARARASADFAPNLRHFMTELSPLDHVILPHLDGTHDRAMLVARVQEALADGRLIIEADHMEEAVEEAVESALSRLAGVAMLEA